MAAVDPDTLTVIGEHRGYAGAGPLELTGTEGDEPYVHISWPGGGMYVTPRQARLIAADLIALATLERDRAGTWRSGARGPEEA